MLRPSSLPLFVLASCLGAGCAPQASNARADGAPDDDPSRHGDAAAGGANQDGGARLAPDAGDSRQDGDAGVIGASDASDDASPPTTDSGAGGGSCFGEPSQQEPIIDVRAFGAQGDGTSDDSDAIQAAIDSLTDGGTVVFPPGTYRYTKVIHVRRTGVRLWGYDGATPGAAGATLHADDLGNQEIALDADRTAIYGFKLTANLDGTRRGAEWNHRIVLDHHTAIEVIDNEILEGTAAGIFAYGATDYLIARNFIGNTHADHIHNTDGCRNGRILFNRIEGELRGDDAIAVVSYDATFNTNILIEGNVVTGSAWGNGVDITGAKDVTVRDNTISEICHNGGIVVKNEPSWNPTGRNENVLVEGNHISRIEEPGCFDLEPPMTGQTGIDVWATTSQGGYNRGLLFRDNTIDTSVPGGIHIREGSCEIGLEDNHVTNSDPALRTDGFVASAMCRLVCAGNTDDDAPASATGCTTGSMPKVTGSSLRCDR